MKAWHGVAAAFVAAGIFCSPGPAAAAGDYPARPVELVVNFPPGGGTDVVARAFAEAARPHMAHGFVVVNKPGAAGAIGLTDVGNAKPDGYRLGFVTVDMTSVPHLGLTKLTVDDFVPVAMLSEDPSALTVRADAPYKTVEEFIAAAKQNPGGLQVANPGMGSIYHLAAEMFEAAVGVDLNPVPFTGANPAVLSLLGGHIDAVVTSPAEVAQHVAAGKLRILGIMAEERMATFPDVPTLREKGHDVVIGAWRGLIAPKGTPQPVVDDLRRISRAALDEPLFRDTLAKQNLSVVYKDQDAFAQVIQSDNVRFRELLSRLGLLVATK
ncbi:tripartite tricarboxylate transporter substrate binding protein [Bordetella sp. 2513F-2]